MESGIKIRKMETADYDQVKALWMSIHGFCIRSIDDSREGVERFIRRNPTTSIVAEKDGQIVGSILCGHDGRTACLYHVCVSEAFRKKGIGRAMVDEALKALRLEKISKVYLVAFTNNEVGNQFWKDMGWTFREDFNYYDFKLNSENHFEFNA